MHTITLQVSQAALDNFASKVEALSGYKVIDPAAFLQASLQSDADVDKFDMYACTVAESDVTHECDWPGLKK